MASHWRPSRSRRRKKSQPMSTPIRRRIRWMSRSCRGTGHPCPSSVQDRTQHPNLPQAERGLAHPPRQAPLSPQQPKAKQRSTTTCTKHNRTANQNMLRKNGQLGTEDHERKRFRIAPFNPYEREPSPASKAKKLWISQRKPLTMSPISYIM